MSTRTSLNNFLAYATAIFLASFAVLFFVVLPLHGKIRSEGDEIQKILAKVENSERKISRLPEFESQYETIRDGEDRIQLLLPEDRAVDFIREIEALADRADGDVTIAQGASPEVAKKKAAPAKEKDDDDTPANVEPKTISESLPWEKSLRLSVRFFGTYPEAVNFLHKIETMPYRIDILALDVRPASDDERREAVVGDLLAAPSPEDGTVAPVPAPVVAEFPVDSTFEIAVYLE